MKNTLFKLVLAMVLITCIPSNGLAANHWVHQYGTAGNYAACLSVADPGGTCVSENCGNYCSLDTANKNAAGGDTVYLKAGTYTSLTSNGSINPTNSGASGSAIHFTAAPGESPLIAPATFWAILLVGKDYIKISNIDFTGSNRFFFIGQGSDHNEITGCTFSTSGTDYYSLGLISQLNTSGEGGDGSTHNWIHGNTFTKYGYVVNEDETCSDGGTIRIATDPTETYGVDASYYNTFEDNVFSYGGHDLVDLGGRYNVIRNNVFHNEEAYFTDPGGCTNSPASGKNGNRNLIVSGYTNTDNNLIEGNRTGHGGTPPDDDGANGIENAGNNMIIRYNYVFGNGATGIVLKNQGMQRPDNNRIYNNTVYYNGYGDEDISSGYKVGISMNLWDFVNVSHNGTTYKCILMHITADDKEPGVSAGWGTYWEVGEVSGARVLDWATYKGATYDVELRPKNNAVKNSIVYANATEHEIYTTGGLNTYTNNLNTDPSFVDPTLTSKTSLTIPNLSLQAGSGAINGGTYLTQANGAAAEASAALIVDSALYFQDGTWGSSLSDIQADWIAIGAVTNAVQISSIDYATNTITLASPMTWADDAPIWLYKKSDGVLVLSGTAPDYGAYEYGGGGTTPPVNTPGGRMDGSFSGTFR